MGKNEGNPYSKDTAELDNKLSTTTNEMWDNLHWSWKK
jgi:hypothetical protein